MPAHPGVALFSDAPILLDEDPRYDLIAHSISLKTLFPNAVY